MNKKTTLHKISPRSARIHHEAILIDTHCDTIGRILDDGKDLGRHLKDGHMDLHRMRKGGVDAQFFACWVDPKIPPTQYARRVLSMMDAFREWSRRYPDQIALASSASDIRACVRNGKIAAILCVEGGHAIEDDLSVLRTFHRLGARYMTLTWMNNNNWADGSGDRPRHHGLTRFGRQVVREMNRLGMMVDISHVSEETFWDVLDTTRTPVLASHSSCKALCNHHRNMTDAQLRAVGKNRGVVCINFYSGFLSEDFHQAQKHGDREMEREIRALKARHSKDAETLKKKINDCKAWYKKRLAPPPKLDLLIDHIDHAARIAGVDHVGLGSDFDGISSLPEDLPDCAHMPLITDRLIRRGYSGQDIQKILGGNVLRLMSETIHEE